MTATPSELLNEAVAKRAGFRCEYCLLPVQGQVAPFELDHIVPRKHGGATVLDNLAYACPHCNAHKWAHTHGLDPESSQSVAIFNPRTQSWAEHFEWVDALAGAPQGLAGSYQEVSIQFFP